MNHFRINTPSTIRLHLDAVAIEQLIRIAIRREVTDMDIENIYTALYPTRRRAVKSLIKQIDYNDLYELNCDTDTIRDNHEHGDRYAYNVCTSRRTTTITKIR